jgi:hypothetical protein
MIVDGTTAALVWTAALAGVIFVVRYVQTRPWRTTEGRLVLAFMGALGSLLVLAVLYRVMGQDSPIWRYLRLGSWITINVIMYGAVVVLFRSQREGRARIKREREGRR